MRWGRFVLVKWEAVRVGARRIALAALLLMAIQPARSGADPATDAMDELNKLSRVAEQDNEAANSAKIALLQAETARVTAENRKSADDAAASRAQVQMQEAQRLANAIAAATYMGGRADALSATLVATSPQQLVDSLSIQRAIASQMGSQLLRLRSAREQAEATAGASRESAAQADIAYAQATSAAADLQAKQSRLQIRIDAVRARYASMSGEQRTALADPGSIAAAVQTGPPPQPALSTPQASAVVQAALSRIGAPYSWGAAGPNAFDCSGLIMWAFQQAGRTLPHSSQALAAGGQPVSRDQIEPGDIVTFYSDASHAGIYIGDGQMVHASTYGTPVKVAPISSAPINNVRRW